MSVRILVGDVRTTLPTLPDASVQCCVTSPPYFGLRDYGHDGQIGLEQTPDEYVAQMVAVFREVRRVLREDGTLWLNIGDSYSRSPEKGGSGPNGKNESRWMYGAAQGAKVGSSDGAVGRADRPGSRSGGLGEKQLLGIPWRVAFALQADGWWLRSDIIWHKPNPMPESVTDRPTKAHEYVFLLTKAERYYYDAAAIAEEAIHAGRVVEYDGTQKNSAAALDPRMRTRVSSNRTVGDSRNARTVWPIEATGNRERECMAILASNLSIADKWDAIKAMMSGSQTEVWRIATQPYKGAHFATMPPALAERCIKAGTRAGDTVLDPFGGAGTTGLVADRLGRDAVLIELNQTYADLARKRIKDDNPMFSEVVA